MMEALRQKTLFERATSYMRNGDTVLDLGAGNGKFTHLFLEAGAKVIAVDKRAPLQPHPDVDWKVVAAEEYIMQLPEDVRFHLVFARNVIQFFDSTWAIKKGLPTLQQHVLPGGLIVIQTFYKQPEPGFTAPAPSLYMLADLQNVFVDWKILYQWQYEHSGTDMHGQTRTFYLTDMIAQKPKPLLTKF
jgi:2-polyprenyl-3-methyl-5-hydroxy-6-metoxy-1,4-benzoquinol methylase